MTVAVWIGSIQTCVIMCVMGKGTVCTCNRVCSTVHELGFFRLERVVQVCFLSVLTAAEIGAYSMCPGEGTSENDVPNQYLYQC